MEIASGSPSRERMLPRCAGRISSVKMRFESRAALVATSRLNCCTQIKRSSTTAPTKMNST